MKKNKKQNTWETDIGSKCTDEKGAFQSWIPWFICIAIGFHHHSDEISSELSSGDVSVIQHLYRCGWTGKGKQKNFVVLPSVYFSAACRGQKTAEQGFGCSKGKNVEASGHANLRAEG